MKLGAEGTEIWGKQQPDSRPLGQGEAGRWTSEARASGKGRRRESGRLELRHVPLPALALSTSNIRGHMGAAILAH